MNFVVNNLNEASTTIDDFVFKVNDIEFNNFEFSTEKTRENGKIKVRLIFSWDKEGDFEEKKTDDIGMTF